MALGWVIRHQKKVLFVLAAVLIVGWVFQRAITQLIGARPESGEQVCGRIAGEDVTYAEFAAFKWYWAKVFRNEFDRYIIQLRYPGDNVTVDEIAWGYLGLLKLARQTGVRVSDRAVLETKRGIYQTYAGRGARLDAQAERWFIENMNVTGQQVDTILRERLMAEAVLRQMMFALEPTDVEAWEQYSAENRAVRVKYVEFFRDGFLDKVPAPSEAEIKEYFEARKGPGGTYYNPPTVSIEYAQLDLDPLKTDVKVPVEELKKYYEDNKDLYLIKEKEGEAGEAEYLLFPEVKPQIEAVLTRRKVEEKAAQVLEDLRRAYRDTVGAQLEALVNERKNEGLKYFRTDPLRDVELLELPGVGIARADGKGLAQMAFELDPARQELSPVLSSAGARFVFRPLGAVREATVPELADVKTRVVADIRKEEAFIEAHRAAEAFREELEKAGGAGKFEDFAKTRGLVVKETPLFVNNVYDVGRPDFIDRMSTLELNEVEGPMSSERDGVSAVVKVVEEREADASGFPAERKLKRDYVLATKVTEFGRSVFPRTVLEFTGHEDLRPPPKSPDETTEGDTTPGEFDDE